MDIRETFPSDIFKFDKIEFNDYSNTNSTRHNSDF